MNVFVYNPISGHGHLDSWNALFVRTLVNQGHNICAYTPDRSALVRDLQARNILESERLTIAGRETDSCSHKTHKHTSSGRVSRFIKRRGRQIEKAIIHLIRPCAARKPVAQAVEDGDPEQGRCKPAHMAHTIVSECLRAHFHPDIVLIMYMDLFARRKDGWLEYDEILGIPWVGVNFHVDPRNDQPVAAWCEARSFQGLAFLDEQLVAKYSRWFLDRAFVCLPDVTDCRMELPLSPLVEILRSRARGRHVVFFGGSIGGQKDLATWVQVVRTMDPNCWFFALIGEMHAYTLSESDKVGLEWIQTHQPENVMVYDQYLSDEREFNSLIRQSSVLYAVYKDFPYSSNMLAKAASLEKPVIVSDAHLMGRRVREFGIGATVPEGNPEEIVAALTRMCLSPPHHDSFSAYREQFSEQVLTDRLNRWLRSSVSVVSREVVRPALSEVA
jgi:glycosyltransferase involved in cell wall biosynthesis